MLKVPNSSSPTGVLEEFFRTEEFVSSEATKNPSSSRFRRIVELLRSTSKKSLENLKIPFHNNAIKSSLRRCTSLRDNLRFGSSSDAHFLVHSPRRIFTFSELKIATNNFAFGKYQIWNLNWGLIVLFTAIRFRVSLIKFVLLIFWFSRLISMGLRVYFKVNQWIKVVMFYDLNC